MTAMSQTSDRGRARLIAQWLILCAALVALMVVVGGVTRLTGSGLAIVEWQPVYGVLPPLSAADWQKLFDAYRVTPQYRTLNPGMTVAEFRGIFWWEYLHRLLGRLIGVAFFLPFAWLLWRQALGRDQIRRYSVIFILGGAQGALGWYMVKSGLIERPWVDPLRLAAHLMLALLIYALLLWEAMRVLRPASDTLPDFRWPRARKMTKVALGMVAATIFTGALMAGSHAGFAFPTFPLIESEFLPSSYFGYDPWYFAPFDHLATINFNHRWLAIATLLLVLCAWTESRWLTLVPRARRIANGMALVGLGQVALGIATVLTGVPFRLASLHQMTALALFTLALALVYELRPPERV